MLISPIKINTPYVNINVNQPSSPQSRVFLHTYPCDSVTFSSNLNSDQIRKVIILIGAPNSGKGTIARALSEHFSLPYIGTGDILRNKLKKGKNFNDIAEKFIEFLGAKPKYKQLVKYFICDTIQEQLKLPEYKNGVILDGFPRNIEEANMLKDILDKEGNIELKIIHLDVQTPLLYKRSAHRFICSECNKTYAFENTENIPKCECGADLLKRDDDTPEILTRRIQKYETETLPLTDYYGDKVVSIEIKDENTNAKDVFTKIITAISEK